MIVFDLCCAAGAHRFEAWFNSSEGFADQQARSLLVCPMCGDTDIRKAVMAPRVGAKSNQMTFAQPPVPVTAQHGSPQPGADGSNAEPSAEPSPEMIRRIVADIAAKQAEMLPQSRWVGREFADAARAMHEGRAADELIHGQTSPDEAQALHEDGITAMPLLVPFVPPDLAN